MHYSYISIIYLLVHLTTSGFESLPLREIGVPVTLIEEYKEASRSYLTLRLDEIDIFRLCAFILFSPVNNPKSDDHIIKFCRVSWVKIMTRVSAMGFPFGPYPKLHQQITF